MSRIDDYGQKWLILNNIEILPATEATQAWRDKNQKETIKPPAELREEAYKFLIKKQDNTSLILWDNKSISVEEASSIYLNYFIEDNAKSTTLKNLIKQAKTYIRNLYPDKK